MHPDLNRADSGKVPALDINALDDATGIQVEVDVDVGLRIGDVIFGVCWKNEKRNINIELAIKINNKAVGG